MPKFQGKASDDDDMDQVSRTIAELWWAVLFLFDLAKLNIYTVAKVFLQCLSIKCLKY